MDGQHRFPVWVRLALCCSGAAYTVLLMQTPSHWSFLITALLALILLGALTLRGRLAERLFACRKPGVCLTAAVLSLAAVYTAKSTFYFTCFRWMDQAVSALGLPSILIRLIPWGVALAALPMAFGYFLWFVDLMWGLALRLWRSSDFTERMFFLGAGILYAMMIVLTYMCTQAFYGASLGGSRYDFDLIYSADSGYLVRTDVFRNVGADQNDLRQPLYGLFAMPFAQAAWLLSRLLFFLPDGYITVWQILQMLLFLIALVLLSRMMGLRGAEKALFLVMISLSYPTLIFVLTAEQYLVAMFYLMLLLYLKQEERGKPLSFIAATGCMLTSGLWFPLVTWDRDFKKFVKRSFALLGAFVTMVVLSGRLTTFLDLPRYIAGFAPYTGMSVAPLDKLMQYVNFAGGCLIAPPSGVDVTSYRHISWQMLPVTGWSPVGIAVLILSAAGFALNRKEPFARICAVWIAFSFVLLGLVGWGTVDNGLLLYSLYFGWAFAALVFKLVDRGFRRFRPAKVALLLGMIFLMALANVYALRNVLVFAAQFFPSLGGIA